MIPGIQGLYISSSWVPIIYLFFYHPWHPGPLHIIILSSQNFLYLIFMIPGIQGLKHIIILSSHNLSIYFLPPLAARALTYHHPEFPIIFLSIFLPSLASRALTYHHPEFPEFSISNILWPLASQGLNISSSWVSHNLSIFYHPWHPGPLHIIILSSQNFLYLIFYDPWHPGL